VRVLLRISTSANRAGGALRGPRSHLACSGIRCSGHVDDKSRGVGSHQARKSAHNLGTGPLRATALRWGPKRIVTISSPHTPIIGRTPSLPLTCRTEKWNLTSEAPKVRCA